MGYRNLKTISALFIAIFSAAGSLHSPEMWPTLVLAIPMAIRLIFDGGRAKAIDTAISAISSLRDHSKDVGVVISMISHTEFSRAIIRLTVLKGQMPDHTDRFQTAIDALEPHKDIGYYASWFRNAERK